MIKQGHSGIPVFTAIQLVFEELKEVLEQITNDEYGTSSERLFKATIGQHVRHIIELYQCLLWGYDAGMVNYEMRKRDINIETDCRLAIQLISGLCEQIALENKEITLYRSFSLDTIPVEISSNYFRELVYNLEHTIHHMALIRVGINELTNVKVSDKFGVAPSTLQYRTSCVQ